MATNAMATGYTGTVHFTSSDGAAVLPANSTLTNGVGTFSVTLKTAGGADDRSNRYGDGSDYRSYGDDYGDGGRVNHVAGENGGYRVWHGDSTI